MAVSLIGGGFAGLHFFPSPTGNEAAGAGATGINLGQFGIIPGTTTYESTLSYNVTLYGFAQLDRLSGFWLLPYAQSFNPGGSATLMSMSYTPLVCGGVGFTCGQPASITTDIFTESPVVGLDPSQWAVSAHIETTISLFILACVTPNEYCELYLDNFFEVFNLASILLPGNGSNLLAIQSLPTQTPTAPPGITPLPAALPLFATGLGALGLLGWRRKRKSAAA